MDKKLQLVIEDAQQMRKLGAYIGVKLRAGDFVVLNGELGAGKTTFTKGVGESIGVTDEITSPTFVISRIHKSKELELIHVDAYRLNNANQLMDLGLEDHPDAIVIMEWGSSFISEMTDEWLQIDFKREYITTYQESADGPRTVTITSYGERWESLNMAEFK